MNSNRSKSLKNSFLRFTDRRFFLFQEAISKLLENSWKSSLRSQSGAFSVVIYSIATLKLPLWSHQRWFFNLFLNQFWNCLLNLKSAIAQTSVLSNGFFCLPILPSEFILRWKETAAKHQVLRSAPFFFSKNHIWRYCNFQLDRLH